VVRIGFHIPARQPKEQAYRLVLAEVPRLGDVPDVGGGVVNFAMQYLLPVFVAPSGRVAHAPLTWSLRTEDDVLVARATNAGARRVAAGRGEPARAGRR
jgi:P pilus assembly chaperone PapD